jgi:hypothetical protein
MKAESPDGRIAQALTGTRILRRSAAIGLAALVLLLVLAVIPLTLVAHQGVLYNLGQAGTFLPIAAVGFLVSWHRPRNPIGWLLIVTAAAALLNYDGDLYALLAIPRRGADGALALGAPGICRRHRIPGSE